MTHIPIRQTASVAVLALGVGSVPALAQESGNTSSDQSNASSGQSGSSSGQSGSTTSGQSMSGDTVVATVGGNDITGQEVATFIESLPAQMQQQPPEMLTSMALEQVILREMILQEAQTQNLSEDPRVDEIANQAADVAREDAMVAVYLRDELGSRVSDQEVQQTYDQLQAQAPDGQELPPLEQVRPQIEQQLQQQALQSLQSDLREQFEVTVYNADGTTSDSGSSNSSQSQ